MVQELVKNGGADVKIVNFAGNTALHLAAANGRVEGLRVLVREGEAGDVAAAKGIKNKEGKVAAEMAKNEESKAILMMHSTE